MKDVIAGSIVVVILFSLLFRIVIDRDYKIKQKMVGDVIYTYTQVISKKGVFSKNIYNQMKLKLQNFGEFEIKIKVEKWIIGSGEILEIEGNQLLNMDLRAEGFDIISVYAQSKKEHLISHIYNNGYQYKLNAIASAPIF